MYTREHDVSSHVLNLAVKKKKETTEGNMPSMAAILDNPSIVLDKTSMSETIYVVGIQLPFISAQPTEIENDELRTNGADQEAEAFPSKRAV